MEINFGDWEMKPFEQNEDPRLQEWYVDYMNVAATGGESFAMQYRRVGQFLDELRKKPIHALPSSHMAAYSSARNSMPESSKPKKPSTH